ncbi:amidohydrolase [Hymenobacter sp. 15J16-1T3B]|uniref:amidohydrolase n=1 Tax=Hymenobacter sp. 15J16-1T3B TaxID=2886941 RepID=UPI001D118E79|nr:amidohydrolase family protein [Hymenobacter sp. 15J16-1T3B]MCC3159276.1 amidohydrolase [Hymenobacter sp. 15J16-1T3B]
MIRPPRLPRLRQLWLPAVLPALLFGLAGCPGARQPADLLVYNATVYPVDSAFSKAEALAVQNGRVVFVGSNAEARQRFKGQAEVDAHGKFIYPGFYDAHCHFYRYALGLRDAVLVGTSSWNDVLRKLRAQRRQYPQGQWLTGRGWDQNDWPTKQFPTKDSLDRQFPDVPVFITRVDGHAALVNQKALDLAGVTARTPISGGVLERDAQGRLTGLLVDNAVDLVSAKIPEPTPAEAAKLLLQAQQECVALGLTSLADAGLEPAQIERLDSLHRAGQLKLRLDAMISASPANVQYYLKKGPTRTDRLTVNSFKVYADGALGSRGACLLHPYTDRPKQTGFLLSSVQEYRQLAQRLAASPFQMNTHAIGDSANRLLLDIYGAVLRGQKDRRWRIEHAQVVSPGDVAKFARYGIVPSVQPTHATSDMYWAGERLGAERLKTAYAYQDLLRATGRLALGSDFPVEYLNPLFGFHAAVARQDAKNFPQGGFQPENAITREAALRGMTVWAAWAAFEDDQKGTLTPGKWADFVILDQDIMTAPAEQLRQVKVLGTYIQGEKVYGTR